MPSKSSVPSVFVKGIPPSTSHEELSQFFSEAAPVKRAFIVRDKITKESRGYGFVQFAMEEDVHLAVEKLNGKTFKDNVITVGVAKFGADFDSKEELKKSKLSQKFKKEGDTHIANFHLSDSHPCSFSTRTRSIALFGLSGTCDKKKLWKRVRKSRGAYELSDAQSLYGSENLNVFFVRFDNTAHRDSAIPLLDNHMWHGFKLVARAAEQLFSPRQGFTHSRLIIRNLTFDASAENTKAAILRNCGNSALLLTDVYVPLKPLEKTTTPTQNASGPAETNDADNKLAVVTEENETGLAEGLKNRGYGFVSVATYRDAKVILEIMNEKKILRRKVAVDWSAPEVVAAYEEAQAAERDAKEAKEAEKRVLEAGAGDAVDTEKGDEDLSDGDSEILDGGDAMDVDGDEDDVNSDSDSDSPSSSDSEKSESSEHKSDANDKEEEEEGPEDKYNSPDSLLSTIFVRNLAFDADEAELVETFKKFGPVHYCKIVVDRTSGRARGSAFLKFYDKASCDRALAAAGAKDEHSEPYDYDPAKHQKSEERRLRALAAAVEKTLLEGTVQLGGRTLQLNRAISKTQAAKKSLSAEAELSRRFDKRHTYLLYEGNLKADSEAMQQMPQADQEKRLAAQKAKKDKMQSPLFFVSPTRLSVRNLAKGVEDADLRAAAAAAARRGLAAGLVDPTEGDPKLFKGIDRMPGKGRAVQWPGVHVERARILREGSGGSKGFGFVEFNHHVHALAALREMNNNPKLAALARGGAAAIAKGAKEQELPRLIVEFAVENLQKVRLHATKQAMRSERQKALQDAGVDVTHSSRTESNSKNDASSRPQSNGDSHRNKARDQRKDGSKIMNRMHEKGAPRRPSTSNEKPFSKKTFASENQRSKNDKRQRDDEYDSFNKALANAAFGDTGAPKKERRIGKKLEAASEVHHDKLVSEYKSKMFGSNIDSKWM